MLRACRRGGTLVGANVADEQAADAERSLSGFNAVAAASEAYRGQGWTSFNQSAPAYTGEQVMAERTL